jgi:hypothetical protein
MNEDLNARLERNFAVVLGEIMAPPRSRFERILIRAHMPEPVARLIASKPAFRWAFVVAVFVVLQVAASGATANGGPEQLAVFLALAPLVPIVGVAMSYGVGVDRSYEVAVAAPLSGLRLVLVRTTVVFISSAAIALVVALLSPTGGWLRFGWVLPGLAGTALTLVVGERIGFRRAALAVGVSWLVVVIVVGQLATTTTSLFAPLGQVVFVAVVLACAGVLWIPRHRFVYGLDS